MTEPSAERMIWNQRGKADSAGGLVIAILSVFAALFLVSFVGTTPRYWDAPAALESKSGGAWTCDKIEWGRTAMRCTLIRNGGTSTIEVPFDQVRRMEVRDR